MVRERELVAAIAVRPKSAYVPEPIRDFIITQHAAEKMAQRGIPAALVEQVLGAPEQRQRQRPGRDVLQARAWFGTRLFFIRVFVDVDLDLTS